jgi:hypothetical protein
MGALNVGGTDYWGFSPENHVGETPTVTAPKYAVYDYLKNNNVNPETPWAQGAADALNKQFNTTQFKPTDAETLAYGDEFVHSGYGGKGALSTPGGTPAFTWGSVTPDSVTGAASGVDPQIMQRILQALGGGGPQNPWTGIAQTLQAATPGANPFMQWLQMEGSNPSRAPQALPTVNHPQAETPDVNQMIEQALMHAFLGGQ